MKLSVYARQVGITYKTAYRMWKAGQLDAYQLPTGTIIVQEAQPPVTGVATYARVSSADQKADLVRQVERLRDYAAAKGYILTREVQEIASGVNDSRPKLASLLSDRRIGLIIVEHRDRLTRFGYNYLRLLLEQQGRRIEVINLADNGKEDLIVDLVSIIYSFSARLYGQRRAKRKTADIHTILASDTHSSVA